MDEKQTGAIEKVSLNGELGTGTTKKQKSKITRTFICVIVKSLRDWADRENLTVAEIERGCGMKTSALRLMRTDDWAPNRKTIALVERYSFQYMREKYGMASREPIIDSYVARMRSWFIESRISMFRLCKVAGLGNGTLNDILKPGWNPSYVTMQKVELYMQKWELYNNPEVLEEIRNLDPNKKGRIHPDNIAAVAEANLAAELATRNSGQPPVLRSPDGKDRSRYL